MTLLANLVEPIPQFKAFNWRAECQSHHAPSVDYPDDFVYDWNGELTKVVEAPDMANAPADSLQLRYGWEGFYLFGQETGMANQGFTKTELFEQFWRVKSITYTWNVSNTITLPPASNSATDTWTSSGTQEVFQSKNENFAYEWIDGNYEYTEQENDLWTPPERPCMTYPKSYEYPIHQLQRTYQGYDRTYEEAKGECRFATLEETTLGLGVRCQGLDFWHVPDFTGSGAGIIWTGGLEAGRYAIDTEIGYRVQGFTHYTYEELPFTVTWGTKVWNGLIPVVQSYVGSGGSNSISGSFTATINEYQFDTP